MDYRFISKPYIRRARGENCDSQNIFKHDDEISVSFNNEAARGSSNNSVAEEGNLLWPVAAFEAGDGLPYAPIDWPNPGDTWSWRVGRRVCRGGYFQDRFLYPPWEIVPIGSPKFFASKSSCQQFLKSNFPDRDQAAFFASFSWKIPAKKDDSSADGENREDVECHDSHRGRKLNSSYTEEEHEPKDVRKCVETREEQESLVSKRGRKIKPRNMEEEDDDVEVYSPLKRKRAQKPRLVSSNEPQSDLTLDELLTLRKPLIPPTESNSKGFSIIGPEVIKAHAKLSSLLSLGFPYLASSEIVKQVTSLASIIRSDSNLSADEQMNLKLAEGLPRVSEIYRETRKIKEEAEEFLKAFENKKMAAISMKNDYTVVREKSKELQKLVDAGVRAEKEIGAEIEVLRAKLREIGRRTEKNRAAKEETDSTERILADSLRFISQSIQASTPMVSEMASKRSAAVKRAAEIVENFNKRVAG